MWSREDEAKNNGEGRKMWSKKEVSSININVDILTVTLVVY